MFGLVEFSIRLLIRYGALIGVVCFAVTLIAALVMLARVGLRPSGASAAWGGCALVALAGLVLLGNAARHGADHLSQAFAARQQIIPAPGGPFAPQSTLLTLSDANAQPIDVRVWYPAESQPSPTRRLILFAPGIGGDRAQNALTLANLASHGYVIVAFDDMAQTTAPANESAEARFMREGPNDYSSRAAYAATMAASNVRVALQAQRAVDILNRFTRVANDSSTPWGGRVDTANVGFLGYSFGGATAAETAVLDPRIAAVANLDGSVWGRAAEGVVRQPYLLMLSDVRMRAPLPDGLRRNVEYLEWRRELAMAATQARRTDSEVVEVQFAEHSMFADSYFNRSHFRQWLTLPPARAYEITQTSVLNFFARYLPSTDAMTQRTPSEPFHEVRQLTGAPA